MNCGRAALLACPAVQIGRVALLACPAVQIVERTRQEQP